MGILQRAYENAKELEDALTLARNLARSVSRDLSRGLAAGLDGALTYTYASLAAAESSGDPWADGDTIEITGGATFVYKSDLATDGYSGLIHADPLNNGGSISAVTIGASEDANTDPDSWSDWTNISTGTQPTNYTLDTSGGKARLLENNAAGVASLNVAGGDSSTLKSFAIFDRITGATDAGTLTCGAWLGSYIDASNSAYCYLSGTNGSTASTNWRAWFRDAYSDTGYPKATESRVWMYCSAGKAAIWFDDDASPAAEETPTPLGIALGAYCTLFAGQAGTDRNASLILGRHKVGTFT